MVALKFKRLFKEAVIPKYETKGSAGMDLVSIQSGHINAGHTTMIKTGLACAIPEGYEMQIRPRSGLAAKHGITVLNSPGTIDSDYRGEICILLQNTNPNLPFKYKQGDRVAQAVIAPVVQPEIQVVEELDETVRGEGGFGSTDIKAEPEVTGNGSSEIDPPTDQEVPDEDEQEVDEDK